MSKFEITTTENPTTIVLPAKCTACYIEMGDRTYYIDDSTGEAIIDHWQTEIEIDSR